MREVSLIWMLSAAVWGGVYGWWGYNSDSVRGLFLSLYFFIGFPVFRAMLSPLLIRFNDGQWNRPKARAMATKNLEDWVMMAALLIVGAGVYWLAVGASGGWVGSWSNAAIGVVPGAAVGLLVCFAESRLRLFDRIAKQLSVETGDSFR